MHLLETVVAPALYHRHESDEVLARLQGSGHPLAKWSNFEKRMTIASLKQDLILLS